MKSLACRDAGKDCDFVAKANTEDAVIKEAIAHAIKSHSMKPSEFDPDMRMKMRAKIKEEPISKSA